MRAKAVEKRRARHLRRQGRSLREIAELLGVSKASVSVWVRDVVLTDEHRDALDQRQPNVRAAAEWNRRRAASARASSRGRGHQRGAESKSDDWLYIAGVMLYWGEGAKSNHSLVLTNADPHLVRLWLRFLREAVCVPEERIRLRIYIHEDTQANVAEPYWLDALGLTRAQLSRTVVKKSWSGGEPRRRLSYGTAAVSVHSTDLSEEVLGALEVLGDFRSDGWRPRSHRQPRLDGPSSAAS